MSDHKLEALLDKCEQVAIESGAHQSYRACRDAFKELREAIATHSPNPALGTSEHQPLSDEQAEALSGLVNSTQISAHESCAVYHALIALGITKDTK